MSHYSLDGRLPQSMAEDVWLAPTAQVIGDVTAPEFRDYSETIAGLLVSKSLIYWSERGDLNSRPPSPQRQLAEFCRTLSDANACLSP